MLQFLVSDPTFSLSKKSTSWPNISNFFNNQNGGLCKKLAVLDQLADELKKMGVEKYKRKKAFDADYKKQNVSRF